MKLTKIHRVLRSKQSDWTKEYIDFNTEKRTNAANSFEKDFSKLRINSAYGKTMKKTKKIFQNTLADQLILVIKSLIKNMMLLFMKLSQF